MRRRVAAGVVVFFLAVSFVAGVAVETADYRIETVRETSGWNSRGFEHVVEYEWRGGAPLTRDYCMRTPVALDSASTAELLKEQMITLTDSENVTGFGSTGLATGACDRAEHRWASWTNGSNRTFCYDYHEAIPGGYRLVREEERTNTAYADVTGAFTHYLRGGQHYYCVEDVTWQPGETKTVRYRYRDNAFSSFKWDALFGDIQAQTVDLVLDPFTNSSRYEADFTLDNSSASYVIKNATVLQNVQYPLLAYNYLNNTDTLDDQVNGSFGFGCVSADCPDNKSVGINPANGALTFTTANGDYLYATDPAAFTFTDDLTVGIWFNHTSNTGYYGILQLAGDGTNNWNGYGLKVYLNSGKVAAVYNEGDGACEFFYETGGTYTTGEYHFVAVEWNISGNRFHLFVDGSRFDAAIDLDCDGILNGSRTTHVGHLESGSYFDGDLDEFFLVEGIGHDLDYLYNSGAGRFYPGEDTVVFESAVMSASKNVTAFVPSWRGNASQVNVSFDGGTNYVTVANNTATSWTHDDKDALTYRVRLEAGEVFANFVVTMPATASEATGRNAILTALNDSVINGTFNYTSDLGIDLRFANGSQYNATFDLFVLSGSTRWAFNYDANEQPPAFHNLTPVLYVWQGSTLIWEQIHDDVKALVNSTS